MQNQKYIKNILKTLLYGHAKAYWLKEEDFITSSSILLRQLVKSKKIILEATTFYHETETCKLYRLKQTRENIKRAKELFRLL